MIDYITTRPKSLLIGPLFVQLGGMAIKCGPLWIPDGLHIWWGDRGVHLFWSDRPHVEFAQA